MRCIICGKEVKNSYICGNCIVEREEVVKVEPIEIVQCSRCGFIRIGGKWKNIELEEAIKNELLKSIYVIDGFDVEDIKIDLRNRELTVSGKLFGDFISVKTPFSLKIKRTTCLKCSRISGGYYESIVQLRADNRKLKDYEISEAKRVIQEVLENEIENEKAFLTKIEEKKEGIDFYFGGRDIGKKISRKIVEKLGGKIIQSKKLAGRKDGVDLFRFTYLVRLPSYENGDIVLKDENICIVKDRRAGKGIDIFTGKSINIKDSKVIARRSDLFEGIVVNIDETVAEVMSNDGRMFMVNKPYATEIGDSVYIFEYNNNYYAFSKKIL